MQFLYEILPVFLFFLAFKFYDIYVATIVGIVATTMQVGISRIVTGKWDRKQLITLGVFVFFGSMTLYFHNPIFVKWKPTVVFWIFGIVIFGYQLFSSKPLMQRLMENMLQDKGEIPLKVWRNINVAWACFFILLGCINLYVAYAFSNEAWVNFKFYGVTGALFAFSLFQAVYLARYMTEHENKN